MTQRDWCRQFRMLLERLLVGRAFPDRLVELSWHEHLLSCGACRELLEAEEALELLLRSLPAPELPPDLSRRLLARLKAERGLVTVTVPEEPRAEGRAPP